MQFSVAAFFKKKKTTESFDIVMKKKKKEKCFIFVTLSGWPFHRFNVKS